MNIKKGRTYRVQGMLDLDVHVLKIVGFGKDYLEIKVCFPYRRNNWIIADHEDVTYKVPLKNFDHWKEI